MLIGVQNGAVTNDIEAFLGLGCVTALSMSSSLDFVVTIDDDRLNMTSFDLYRNGQEQPERCIRASRTSMRCPSPAI
jgi:hypothetical protein